MAENVRGGENRHGLSRADDLAQSGDDRRRANQRGHYPRTRRRRGVANLHERVESGPRCGGLLCPNPKVFAQNNSPTNSSGGLRQRVMIAMAIGWPVPRLLIADEPTTRA